MLGRFEYKTKYYNPVCDACEHIEQCVDRRCPAMDSLLDLINVRDLELKRQHLHCLMTDLVADFSEVSQEYEELANQIIEKFDHLHFIKDNEISVGYVISYENKTKGKKYVFGKCEKVSKENKAYLPFDFIITMYEPNVSMLDDNQKKIVMLHELQHIEIGSKGLKIRDHDIEDFSNIVKAFGYNWNDWLNDEVQVPDILGGDIDEI